MDGRQLDAPPGTGHDQPAEKHCSLFDTEPAKGRLTPEVRLLRPRGLMAGTTSTMTTCSERTPTNAVPENWRRSRGSREKLDLLWNSVLSD